MTDKDDAFLEDVFAAARDADASVSGALLERVVTDSTLVSRPPVKESFWESLVTTIGGWPALGGVAMAGVVGVWIGLLPPTQVETFAADILGTTTSVSFLGDFDDLIEMELADG